MPPIRERLRGIRWQWALALVVAAGAVTFLVAGPLQSNIVYFRTVEEAVQQRQDGDTSRFRLAGEVVAGSVEETEAGVEFDVTDGVEVAHVVHQGDPPQLFGAEVPVVCEGRWDGEHFASDRILIRHGNEYSPPEVTTTTPSPGGGAGR